MEINDNWVRLSHVWRIEKICEFIVRGM